MLLTNLLVAMGIALGAIMLLYIVVRIIAGNTIITSKIMSDPSAEADLYYYLPGYQLHLEVNAIILLQRVKGKKTVLSASLEGVVVKPAATIVPDTTNLVIVEYFNNWFTSDDIELSASANALLENATIQTEDRIESIVTLFTKEASDMEPVKVAVHDFREMTDRGKVETEYVRITVKGVFEFPAAAFHEGKVFQVWKIPVDGLEKPIEASFYIHPAIREAGFEFPEKFSYKGLLTRPLVHRSFEIHMGGSVKPIKFGAMVPDSSRLMKIPLRNSYFTTRKQLPKFSNGVLVKNHITKASEVEGFAAIPINIFKAIFSIPAQLFQFNINRNKMMAELEQSKTALKAAIAANVEQAVQKAVPLAKREAGNTIDYVLGKKPEDPIVPVVKPDSPPKPDDEGPGPLPPLGKRPYQPDSRIELELKKNKIQFEKEFRLEALDVEVPTSSFWNKKYSGPWNGYRNVPGGIQDCIPAAAAHILTLWSSNTQDVPVILTVDEVVRLYSRESGYDSSSGDNDQGCILVDFMWNWNKKGIGNANRKIGLFQSLTKGDTQQVKQAITYFGACMIGLALPEYLQYVSRSGKPFWQLVTAPPKGSVEPGSWDNHAVAAIGYDEQGITVISWGIEVVISWEFYSKYNDESYVMISADWVPQRGTAPSGKDLAGLEKIFEQLTYTA